MLWVKHVGALIEQESKKEPGTKFFKRQVVLYKKVSRMGENGTYLKEQDYVVDLTGRSAEGFTVETGTLIAANLGFTAVEYQGRFFQNITLDRYTVIADNPYCQQS